MADLKIDEAKLDLSALEWRTPCFAIFGIIDNVTVGTAETEAEQHYAVPFAEWTITHTKTNGEQLIAIAFERELRSYEKDDPEDPIEFGISIKYDALQIYSDTINAEWSNKSYGAQWITHDVSGEDAGNHTITVRLLRTNDGGIGRSSVRGLRCLKQLMVSE